MQRPLTMLVLACALFLRVWVPAGWMPAATGRVFAIEPCAAAAPLPMTMAHAQGSHHRSHKDEHQGDCSFAPHDAGFTVAAFPAVSPPPQLAAAALPVHLSASSFPTGPPAPPPPATGPPTLV